MRYAKILENGSLECAPRNIDGVSNWIEDVDAVKAAGYLPVSEEVIPQGYVVSGWIVKTGEIVPILEKIPEPTIAEQNEAIRQTREQLYIQISDKLKADYDEAVARGADNVEELKTAWLESKDKIRAENPYVEESVEEAPDESVAEPVVKESNSSDSVLSEASENKGQSESESEEVI